MEYDRVEQIEKWFRNYNWNVTEEEIENKRNEYPEKFFKAFTYHFWNFLSILDVINLALTYKYAAYQAYYWNIEGFRTLCDTAWKTKKLDLSEIHGIKYDSLVQILKAFKPLEIIYPTDITDRVLCHLPDAKKFTFNLHWQGAYVRPAYGPSGNVHLTVHGIFCMNLRDPLIDLLLTFPRLTTLNLKNIYFTTSTVGILRSTYFKNLIINQSSLAPFREEDFLNAILNNKQELMSIVIANDSDYAWERVILDIVDKISQFKRIKHLEFPLRINWRSAKKLKKLCESKTLNFVHIRTNSQYINPGNKIKRYLVSNLKRHNIIIKLEKKNLIQLIPDSEWYESN